MLHGSEAGGRKSRPSRITECYNMTLGMTKAESLEKRPRKPVPRLKIVAGHLSADCPDEAAGHIRVMKAIGTLDPDFYATLISQLANIAAGDEQALNSMMAMIKGIEPRDQMEAMLAAQMAAVHMATMTLARRLAQADIIQKQDSASTAFNKLARTFAAQMEALKRYRSTGEQTVTVQHVQVNEGGQAIVGNVTPGAVGKKDTTA
jgi:hypothetical protein